MTFTMDNYPEYFDYVTLQMVYGSVTGDSMIIGLTPKISLQANWKPINELELIPFVTFSINMTDTETFVYTSDTEQDLAYTSINFGLEAVFFDSFLLSSMVQFLNNGSDTKIITLNLSIPVK